ncbi:PAS domain-containing protein, partial [Pelomonas sp. KK5]|uniref:PAS domain-containing protein n=1 Tax=Pelomonas sp. KK5 TaxID=1855730 RepID=UPI00117E3409
MTTELAALLDGLLEAVWLIDGRSRCIVAANAAAGRLLGAEPAGWQGAGVESLLQSPEDALFWLEAATNTRASLDSDTLLARADGIVLSVRRRIAFVEHGAAAGHWLLAIRDQTRQRALEQARAAMALELQAAR